MTEHSSYAQIHEDTTLWNLVGHDKATGFYVDVGANDPYHYSVSMSFYEAGWTGINIEPQAEFVLALNKAQPDALTLQAMLSDSARADYLFVSKDPEQSGWATAQRDIADKHGFTTRVLCSVLTLADVCESYAVPEHYDWLKVDVEGHELQVLQGGDWAFWRPNFLCIESVDPVKQQPSHYEWDNFITSRGYEWVDSDRYNRYYKRKEYNG